MAVPPDGFTAARDGRSDLLRGERAVHPEAGRGTPGDAAESRPTGARCDVDRYPVRHGDQRFLHVRHRSPSRLPSPYGHLPQYVVSTRRRLRRTPRSDSSRLDPVTERPFVSRTGRQQWLLADRVCHLGVPGSNRQNGESFPCKQPGHAPGSPHSETSRCSACSAGELEAAAPTSNSMSDRLRQQTRNCVLSPPDGAGPDPPGGRPTRGRRGSSAAQRAARS